MKSWPSFEAICWGICHVFVENLLRPAAVGCSHKLRIKFSGWGHEQTLPANPPKDPYRAIIRHPALYALADFANSSSAGCPLPSSVA